MIEVSVTCWQCRRKYVLLVSESGYDRWRAGAFIQDALPELSAEERELLISKTCDPCFNEMFPEDED